jgi:hypothetical protein
MSRRLTVLFLLVPGALVCACGGRQSAPEAIPSREPTPTLVATPSPTATPLLTFETSGETVYQDSVGSTRFLFEVRNTNEIPTERVWATVKLRDAEGQLLASQTAYARLDILEPNGSAPVLVVFFLSSPDFASYEIDVGAHEADYLPKLVHGHLEIADSQTRVGEWVPYEVLGEVHNDTGLDAESVTLVVSCRDEEGRTVAVATGRPESRYVGAGESSAFLVTVGHVAGDVETCTVQVEGLISVDD